MSYTTHNFASGEVIYAADLNEMDAQIAANEAATTVDATLTQTGKPADAKKTGDEITSIKGDLSQLEGLGGIVTSQYFVPPIAGTGNISREDGSVVTNSSYSYSDYIDISKFSQLTTKSLYDGAFNVFYDSSKAFIEAFTVRTGTDLTITIPENAVYMRVSNPTAKYTDTFQFKTLGYDNAVKIDDLSDSLNALAEQGTDYFVPAIEGTGYISLEDGSVVSSSTYSHSDYIDISEFTELTTKASYDGSFNAFYNSSKTFISSFTVRTGTDLTIAIPDNAVYMRVSTTTAKYTDTYVFKSLSHSNAARIADLEDEVTSLAGQGTDYFMPPIEGTGYISRDDGTLVSSSTYSHSDYFDISEFKVLTTKAAQDGNFNAFYTSDKAFISAFTVRAGTDLTIEIPDNAVYMRVSTGTASYATTYIFKSLSHSNAARIETLEDAVAILSDGGAEYFVPEIAGTGNISRDDGTIATSTYKYSNYIDISQYPQILTVAEYTSSFNAFYDVSKTFIEPFAIEVGTDKIITPPVGAMYMRVSASATKYDATMRFRTMDYVTSDLLPEYWMQHVLPKCETLRNRMATIGKFGTTFVFVTDIHWYRNRQKSPKIIKYLLNHLNINMVILGGDLITQGEEDTEILESIRCVKAFRFPDVFTPITFGNHDNNSNQDDATARFDTNTIYSLFMKSYEDSVTWMSDTEFSFYFDKPANKTRYICLDMGDDGVSKAFTAYEGFRDALLSTPSGYKIVIIAHIIDYGTFTTSLTTMIDAYNARTSVTVNSVVCDFSNASGSVVICLGGHRHFDAEVATSGGVPITVTDCDALLSTQYEETEETITEQAFDVVSIDYTNAMAYYERIGRGGNRTIHLTPVAASTTLTTSLTGTITWSSSDTNIATVSSGTITRVTTGTVTIKADNGTEAEVWICNS